MDIIGDESVRYVRANSPGEPEGNDYAVSLQIFSQCGHSSNALIVIV